MFKTQLYYHNHTIIVVGTETRRNHSKIVCERALALLDNTVY